MLRLPANGLQFSKNKHNIQRNVFIEWIEASITFIDLKISQSDVVDILIEEVVYLEQDFAYEMVEIAWSELRRRQKILGAFCPYEVVGRNVIRKHEWQDRPAYSFCLMVAIQVLYREVFKNSADFTTQGELFEHLTDAALKTFGFNVLQAGWSKQATENIESRLSTLADFLGESAMVENIQTWASPMFKDGGLDIVCLLPFQDNWGGRPVFFVQCASGENWKSKKASPIIATWEKLIDFTTKPRRGIAIPFTLSEDEFRREANDEGLALLLDRYRLCGPKNCKPKEWPEAKLRVKLNKWTQKKIKKLPKADFV